MDSAKEAKETLNTINRVLPNIQSYLCNVLKKENLSLEAEALRARYETMLMHLEKRQSENGTSTNSISGSGGSSPSQRHSSIAAFDRPPLNRGNTLPARRRTESDFSPFRHMHTGSMDGIHTIPEVQVPKTTPELAGFLLYQDEHERWHKRHCRLSSQHKTLTIHESPSDEDQPISEISLDGAAFIPNPPECDKDLSFGIRVAPTDVSLLSPVPEVKEVNLHTFAAFSEVDLTKWQSTLESVISSTGQTLNIPPSATSTHSRDSVFAGVGRSDDDILAPIQGRPPEPLPTHDSDEGNQSDCTIYEDIDELVQEFDKTMQATAQAMSEMSPKKPKKKRKRNLFEKSQDSSKEVLSEHKTKLEVGDRFSGYLHKRTGSSWKKKWCQLKGCIFSYTKSPSDSTAHEYILLRAEISIVKDVKKPHAFKLACKGVKEAFFAADDEAELLDWVSKLQNASKRSDDLSGLVDDSGVEEGGDSLPEGIYNVPRNMLNDDTPIIDPITNTPIAGGIYDVPRSLLAEGGGTNPQTVVSQEGVEFHMTGNPFDLYDVPRSTLEDDTIYDYPLDFDLGDMEIYDYPPDAAQLEEILHPSRDSNSSNEYPMVDNDSSSHSHTPGSADGTMSSTSSYRQSGSIGSVEDVSSSGTTSLFSDGYRSLPRNKSPQVESFLSGLNDHHKIPSDSNKLSSQPMEFGQVTKTGNLLRKERLKWSNCFCLVRNSFLECHKSNAASMGKPLLKLLLLGSEVTPAQDTKKQYAFQVKHPRRDGILIFAAESATDYNSWVNAFKSASSIKVQQVSTMEDIRISDSDLKKKWKSHEKNLGDDQVKEPEESPKRDKRKLFGRQSQRKSSRKSRNPSEFYSSMSVDTDSGSMKRSLSMELITRPTESTPFGPKIASQAHRAISPEGLPCFQGYLRMKSSQDEKWSRLWCMFEDMMIKCYTSQRNLSIVKQIPLRGCTIARADAEAKRKFTFRVWNSDTLESIYLSSTEEDDYQSWMTEITKGAIKQKAADPNQPTAIVYYYPKDYQPSPQIQSTQPTITTSAPNIQSRNLPEKPVEQPPVVDMPGVTHHGPLKKRSEKGNWNVRYCRLRESCLYVYYTGSDQTPITVLAVKHCKVERIQLSPDEQSSESHTFIVAVKGGKTHMFAGADEQDVQTWLKVLVECTLISSPRIRSDSKSGVTGRQSPLLASHSKVDSGPSSSPYRNRSSSLISHVPASTLTDPSITGYCEIFIGKGVWSRNWCVLHQSLLYVYQNKESKSSIRTVALQGYKVEHIPSVEKQYMLSLKHTNNPNLLMATNSQADMMKWFQILESVTTVSTSQTTADETTSTTSSTTSNQQETEDKPESITNVSTNTEASEDTGDPMSSMQEHIKQMEAEGDALSSLPPLGEGPLNTAEYKEKCQLVASHFEKRIKKTRKVAQQTEESLKKQREQITNLKEKFIEHIEKLKIAAPNESGTSQKKMKDMEVKLTQIGKILPYLEKYMQANRQAELQTLAILKEGCTVKLQQLENRYRHRSSSTSHSPAIGKLDRRMSMPTKIGSPLHSSSKSKKTRSSSATTTTDNKGEVKIEEHSNIEVADSSSVVPQTSTTADPLPTQERPRVNDEEPAYATVGHLKHTREPSLPEHYVKLQLNQNVGGQSNNNSVQQEVGVHYSTVNVSSKKHDLIKHSIAVVDEPTSSSDMSFSQDRGQDTTKCVTESPTQSPLPFLSSPGPPEDSERDLLNTTSSETSLGLLDTVMEELDMANVISKPPVTAPSPPVDTEPVPPPTLSSTPPTSVLSTPTPPLTTNPILDTPPVPTPPPTSSILDTPPVPTPPPSSILDTHHVPLSQPQTILDPKETFQVNDSSNKLINNQNDSSPLPADVNVVATRSISPTKRPPPPPVMKKTKSPRKQHSPSPPTVPRKTIPAPPPSSGTSPTPPPPVKAKPKRNRTSIPQQLDDTEINYIPSTSQNLSTVAQRRKAFQ